MAPLCLVRPTSEDAEIFWDYRWEFLENGEVIHGGAGLANAASPQAWLQALEQNSCEESVAPGLVPATTLLAIRQNNLRMVGIIDIRHRLNDYLFRYGGHIGYSVRKSERRKGYAAASFIRHFSSAGRSLVFPGFSSPVTSATFPPPAPFALRAVFWKMRSWKGLAESWCSATGSILLPFKVNKHKEVP
ncbi:MAG: hypothetical protein SOX72_05045, partial [Oscillospiraceae bacterium]|nr:hypothetical protein [Oscillospiraceae bacterium]